MDTLSTVYVSLNAKGRFVKTGFKWSVWTVPRVTERAEIVRFNPRSITVRLPDGNVIKRKQWAEVP